MRPRVELRAARRLRRPLGAALRASAIRRADISTLRPCAAEKVPIPGGILFAGNVITQIERAPLEPERIFMRFLGGPGRFVAPARNVPVIVIVNLESAAAARLILVAIPIQAF